MFSCVFNKQNLNELEKKTPVILARAFLLHSNSISSSDKLVGCFIQSVQFLRASRDLFFHPPLGYLRLFG